MLNKLSERLLKIIDWFIPAELKVITANLWRARIFTISHLLGPCSAIAILGYLYRALQVHDVVFWTICGLCGAFWLLPVGLKFSRTLTWLALCSFCDLTLISVVGSYFYGGVSSPFLPWCLAALLIGFFYLGDRPFLVLGIFTASLAGFCVAYLLNGSFPERVPLNDLSTVGMISVLCATLYTSMMAIYYAYVMTAQSALRQEIEKRLLTAAKLEKAKREAKIEDDFPAVSYEQWRALAEADLKTGRCFDQKLVSHTYEGIDIQPLYTQRDQFDSGEGLRVRPQPSQRINLVSVAGGTSGSGWDLRQEHAHSDLKLVNQAILEDLAGGVTWDCVQFDSVRARHGFDPDDRAGD